MPRPLSIEIATRYVRSLEPMESHVALRARALPAGRIELRAEESLRQMNDNKTFTSRWATAEVVCVLEPAEAAALRAVLDAALATLPAPEVARVS